MGEDTNISKLLRMKRYEQPPPGYFDDFLREFQRRQRAELLHQPAWRTFWDRLMAIAPSFRVPQLAYAAIIACALVTSVMIVQHPNGGGSIAVAKSESTAQPAFSLTAKPVTINEAIPVATQLPPHYVLQPRPVSNEQPLSF